MLELCVIISLDLPMNATVESLTFHRQIHRHQVVCILFAPHQDRWKERGLSSQADLVQCPGRRH